jgi:hypothetical protein
LNRTFFTWWWDVPSKPVCAPPPMIHWRSLWASKINSGFLFYGDQEPTSFDTLQGCLQGWICSSYSTGKNKISSSCRFMARNICVILLIWYLHLESFFTIKSSRGSNPSYTIQKSYLRCSVFVVFCDTVDLCVNIWPFVRFRQKPLSLYC